MHKIPSIFSFYFRPLCFLALSLTVYFCLNRHFRLYIDHTSSTKIGFNYKVIQSKSAVYYENIILGDSTATFSLYPHYIPNAVNLSQLAGSPAESFILFQRYLNRHPRPKRVVMTFSFNDFFYRERFWSTYVRNNFYSISELLQILNESRRFKSFPGNENSNTMGLVKYIQSNLYLDFIWIDSLRDSLLIRKEYFSNNSLLINMETINLLKESNGALVTKYYKPIDLSHFKYLEKKFNVNSFYTFSLEKLLHLCANKQISVFLFVPPIANSLLNKNSSRFFQTLTSYLDKLQKRYPKHFINFSLSPYPSSKMIGGNHTNRIGGVEFSKKVYKYIQFMEEKNSKMINK